MRSLDFRPEIIDVAGDRDIMLLQTARFENELHAANNLFPGEDHIEAGVGGSELESGGQDLLGGQDEGGEVPVDIALGADIKLECGGA